MKKSLLTLIPLVSLVLTSCIPKTLKGELVTELVLMHEGKPVTLYDPNRAGIRPDILKLDTGLNLIQCSFSPDIDANWALKNMSNSPNFTDKININDVCNKYAPFVIDFKNWR